MAVQDTVKSFLRRVGNDLPAPTEAEIGLLEAAGVTSEWDMTPILIGIAIDQMSAATDWKPAERSVSACLDEIGRQPGLPRTIDYERVLTLLPDLKLAQRGVAPAEALLARLQKGAAPELFSTLRTLPVLPALFSGTRRVDASETTHLFQTYVLGSRAFARAFGVETPIHSLSYLQLHDKPLISPESLKMLAQAQYTRRAFPAIYTARPSLPVTTEAKGEAMYCPEANLALDLLGVEWIPLVGYGQMGELGGKTGRDADELLKPAPEQALTGVAAAWHRDVPTGITAAANWFTTKSMRDWLPESFRLNVFEDSPGGLMGGLRAAELLRASGHQVETRLWGITTHPVKAEALARLGATVYPDVNQAIALALG